MRVKTYTLKVRFMDNSEKIFNNLSRVAAQRYTEYYLKQFGTQVYEMIEEHNA